MLVGETSVKEQGWPRPARAVRDGGAGAREGGLGGQRGFSEELCLLAARLGEGHTPDLTVSSPGHCLHLPTHTLTVNVLLSELDCPCSTPASRLAHSRCTIIFRMKPTEKAPLGLSLRGSRCVRAGVLGASWCCPGCREWPRQGPHPNQGRTKGSDLGPGAAWAHLPRGPPLLALGSRGLPPHVNERFHLVAKPEAALGRRGAPP